MPFTVNKLTKQSYLINGIRVIKNINSTLPSIQKKIGLRLHDGFETQSFFKTRQIFKGIANRSVKSDRRATLA